MLMLRFLKSDNATRMGCYNLLAFITSHTQNTILTKQSIHHTPLCGISSFSPLNLLIPSISSSPRLADTIYTLSDDDRTLWGTNRRQNFQQHLLFFPFLSCVGNDLFSCVCVWRDIYRTHHVDWRTRGSKLGIYYYTGWLDESKIF